MFQKERRPHEGGWAWSLPHTRREYALPRGPHSRHESNLRKGPSRSCSRSPSGSRSRSWPLSPASVHDCSPGVGKGTEKQVPLILHSPSQSFRGGHHLGPCGSPSGWSWKTQSPHTEISPGDIWVTPADHPRQMGSSGMAGKRGRAPFRGLFTSALGFVDTRS